MKGEAARTLHGGIVRTGQTRSNPVKPSQGESNQIKPSAFAKATARQARLSPPYAEASRKRRSSCGCATFVPYRGFFHGLARIKVNQTKSNL
jgi:hypothetical protein